jgi:diguanylate cyclase (GGDEF)-like protein
MTLKVRPSSTPAPAPPGQPDRITAVPWLTYNSDLWERVQLLAIQAVMGLIVGCQASTSAFHMPHAWLWAMIVLVPSAVLLMGFRLEERAIAWLTALDTAVLLASCAVEPAVGVPVAVGVVVIFLLISCCASLADRIILGLLVSCVLAAISDQFNLLKPEHALLLPVGALLLILVPSRGQSFGTEGPLALTDEPPSSLGRDVLTGLPNRQAFVQHVWRSIRWRRLNPGGHFAVLFIDLDNFKPINDHFGHQAGDAVLQRVAKRLQARLKSADVAARYGGDEFVLLLNQVQSQDDVARVAERLVAAIQEPIHVGQSVSVGASVGIALSTNVHAAPEDLIKDADAAMYRAKAKGKNQYMFSEQTHDASPIELKARLRRLVQAWAE